MAGKSKNKYDVYRWIRDQVIPSCKNPDHQLTTYRLIDNFERTYNDQGLTYRLRVKL